MRRALSAWDIGPLCMRHSRALTPAVALVSTDRARRWLVQWILSFGGEAEVVEPAWAREAVSRAALGALEGTR